VFSFLLRKEKWFVSHSYEDTPYLAHLREALPKRIVPVIFPPIDVPVTEFVSDRILDAVEDCKCLVFMDTAVSKRSFWVPLEIEHAKRQKRTVYRFDPSLRRISEDVSPPLELPIYISFVAVDEARVREIALWAKHRRGFNLWYQEQIGLLNEIFERTHAELWSTMEAGGHLIAFVSKWSATRGNLRNEVVKALKICPTNVLLAWLDDPHGNEIPGVSIPQERQIFLRPSLAHEQSFENPFGGRWRGLKEITSGKDLPVLAHDIDDLIVRVASITASATFGHSA